MVNAGFSFYSFFTLCFSLMMGGEESLSGYISPEAYWEAREVAYEVSALSAILSVAEEEEVDVETWIAALGADDFKTREQASQQLAVMGMSAKPLLEQAAESDDPEVSQRAKKLLTQIQPVDEESEEQDQWMALFSLIQMDRPDAWEVVQSVAEGPENDLQHMARKSLERKSLPEQNLPAGNDVLASFPDDSIGVAQFTMRSFDSPIVNTVHQLPRIQKALISMVSSIGDITIRRVSLAMNKGMLLNDEGQLTLWLEVDYDPEVIVSFAKSKNFMVKTETGMQVLILDQWQVVLVDSHHMLAVFRTEKIEESFLLTAKALADGNKKALPFGDELTALYSGLPADKDLKVAAVFPENVLSKFGPVSTAETFSLYGDIHVKGLEGEVKVTHEDPASTAELNTYIQEALVEGRNVLKNERDPAAHAVLQIIDTLRFTLNETQLRCTFTLLNAFPSNSLRSHEQMLQMKEQMMRERVILH
ncbi:hypothetical protein P3T73_00350 [Kiritimatiellota bacterium B12222]|nr:hypothetical protein P3T73_00350 [Kiritimatiellota bacterium B12222]